MNGFDLLEAISWADPQYIEAADRPIPQKRPKLQSLAACAAVFLLILAAGGTAFATGLYEDLLLYFKGNTEPHMEGIIAANTSVSNEEVTLRIDGAIADSHACYMIVSLTGHTAESKKEILQKFESSEGVGLDTYAVTNRGMKLTYLHWGLSMHRNKIGWRKYSMSRFEDTDATYVVSCEIGKHYPMDSIDRLCITYGDLTAELELQNYRTPEYTLVSPEESPEISNGFLSAVGMYFEVPVELVSSDKREYPLFDIQMIRNDGSIEENLPFGFSCGTGYNAGDKTAPVFGSWKQAGEHSIYILDLSAYQGIRINGIDYFFQ